MGGQARSDHCEWCIRERATRNEYLAQRVDVWKTASALIKELGGEQPPDPEHVLALCEFLEGET